MKHNYTVFIVGIALAGTLLAEQQKFSPIQLNPDIIGLIDGRSFAISGEVIGAMYKIIRDIQAIQLGKRIPSGERVGLYIFENQKHCIRSLIPVEKKIKEEITLLRSKNNLTDQEKNLLTGLEGRLAVLQKLHDRMHTDFRAIVDPFMDDARSSKGPLTILIQEECEKRNKLNSLLLEWANLDAGEMDSFDRKVNTFTAFDEFCSDLATFMSDLIHNCKKGRAQFEKLVEKYNQK